MSDDFIFNMRREKHIDGFTAMDGTIAFYNFVKAIMLKTKASAVLDFGAGRGAFWHDETSVYRREVRDLRTSGAHVTACDVDQAVMTHPCSNDQVVITPEGALPFADASFDVIVSDMTFEHIAEPEKIAGELIRILRPGGYICARTPSHLGYVRAVSQLIPNRLHARFIEFVQPTRKSEDVFPTVYKLNSLRAIKNKFSGCDVFHYYSSGDPAYHFNNPIIYLLQAALHRILPGPFATSACFFIRKPNK